MDNKNRNVNTVYKMIIMYTIVGAILPIIFKYVIFESKVISNLSNNEWAGFLGSYVGGILGGLGTLIAVFITVKDSRDMQAENKKDTDSRILEAKNEKERERKEEKALDELKERKQFAEDISVYVGKYITHISNYYYATRWAETLNSDYIYAKDELIKIENELSQLYKKIDKTDVNSEEFIKLKIKKEYLSDKKSSRERDYIEKLNKKNENSKNGNRLEANECYFILNTKLYGIKLAKEFLKQLSVLHNDMFYNLNPIGMEKDWLKTNSDLLIEEYNVFKEKYII